MKVLIKDEGMVELIKLKRYLKIMINRYQEELKRQQFLPTEEKVCKAKLVVYEEIYNKLQIYDSADTIVKASSSGHVGRGR